MFANHVVEDIPYNSFFALNHFLGSFNDGCQTAQLELAKNKWLEQFQSHFLRQTALMQTQGWTYHDHRTTGVVNALTEQVLTETTLLTFDHVSQRFQRTLVRTGDRATATTVIQQCIYRFLQHAFFVAHDNVRRIQIQQTLQTVVAVDYATIQIIQIRGRKTTTVEWNQRTQVWRQHWQHFHDHPLRLIAGEMECFQKLQAFGIFFDFGFAG